MNQERDIILVSACLLGAKVRYDGKVIKNPLAIELLNFYDIIPICPEMDGGLPCPRVPSEIQEDKVINKSKKDVTEFYKKGASQTLYIAKLKNVKFAVLKDHSPSCGVNQIHDGTFTGRLIDGQGITAKLLMDNGFKVYSEEDIPNILSKLKKVDAD